LKIFCTQKPNELGISRIKKINYENIIYYWDDFKNPNEIDNKYSIKNFQNADLLSTFYNPQFKAAFDNFINIEKPDCVVVYYLWNDYFIQNLEHTCIKIIDTNDILHIKTDLFNEYKKTVRFPITKEQEQELLSRYDYILAIQENEKNFLQKLIPDKKVMLTKHSSKVKSHKITSKVKNIIYAGSQAAHSIDSILWFIKEVWDKYSESDLTLKIFGPVSWQLENMESIKKYKNIKLCGNVEDISVIYDTADIIINPVLYGTGLKIKNVEALCNGIPLITTNEGANGLEDTINKAFLLANTPEEFYNRINSLITNLELRQELAQNSIAYAKQNFTDEACYQELITIISSSL
jgi:glycosyltransferase involved in cell wall biosynthesis